MCGGYTGEHENMVMKTAKIINDGGFVVELYENDTLFGIVDVRNHSEYYANDVVENWQNGILTKDNKHIKRSSEIEN